MSDHVEIDGTSYEVAEVLGAAVLAVLVDALEQAQQDAARWRAFAKTAELTGETGTGGIWWFSGRAIWWLPVDGVPTADKYADALIAKQASEVPETGHPTPAPKNRFEAKFSAMKADANEVLP